MNINTIHITGNLTEDPERRYTPSGKAVVSASIANNEHYTDAQGEEKKVTTFVNLQIWGKPAENFGNLNGVPPMRALRRDAGNVAGPFSREPLASLRIVQL
jgi:hypothetical protein